MNFLSVIIPVYKVEKYLNRCVDSIINNAKEKITDLEIILVDDGSPDGSPVICDEYAKKYSFVKVIHRENGGVSSARNEGMKVASGDYITFVDSDDYVNENFSKVLDIISKSKDVEIFMCQKLIGDEKLFQFESLNLEDGSNLIKIFKNNFENVWNKTFSRKFLVENNIFF